MSLPAGFGIATNCVFSHTQRKSGGSFSRGQQAVARKRRRPGRATIAGDRRSNVKVKGVLRRIVESTGYSLVKVRKASATNAKRPALPADDAPYDQDGLRSIHIHEFMREPAFCRAYERGCRAASDYKWHWRVHIGLWAAFTASKLPGDFVECGVNRGFLSSAIMELLDWDSLNKTFYLLDTFEGLDQEQVSEDELDQGAMEKSRSRLADGFYVRGVESVKANFAEWKNVRIIQGSVPGTLAAVPSPQVAYLHLDMNCAPPEVAALDHFWDRLVPGAVVLMDDYAFWHCEPQKHALDAFAREKNAMIASLPTGQGLLLKPPTG
jgi:hypothetical protein